MTHHVAILKETHFHRILDGTKTVECRFARVRRVPFGAIHARDVLWLKLSGGSVVVIATAAWIDLVERRNEALSHPIPARYTATLRANPEYLSGLAAARSSDCGRQETRGNCRESTRPRPLGFSASSGGFHFLLRTPSLLFNHPVLLYGNPVENDDAPTHYSDSSIQLLHINVEIQHRD